MKKKIKWMLGISSFIIVVGIAVCILLKYRDESMYTSSRIMSHFEGKIIELDEKKKEMVVEITSSYDDTPDDMISLKKGEHFFVEHYYSAHISEYEGPLRPEIGMEVSAYFWDDEQSRQENGELEERNGLPLLRDVAMSPIE